MSLGNAVFLKKSKMPSPAQWAAEIRRQGFELSFEPFDVKTLSGFLPCMYRGRASGFEYFYERVADAELEDDVRRRASGFDVMVTLVTHSTPEHHTCAVIASAVLTKLTGGLHWHHESNEFGTAAELLAWARDEDSNALDAPTAPPPARPPPRPQPRAIDVQLEARVVFRGEQLLMLESVEAAPRRFTVRLPTAELPNVAEVKVTRLWDDGLGPPTVGTLVIGGVSKDFTAFPA